MVQIRRFLLISAVFLIMAAGAPPVLRAEIMVEVRNTTNGKAFISFSYLDAISGSRVTRGWWEVAPFATREIRVNTDDDEFSWYARNERGGKWGGTDGDARSEERHVVLEDFFVKEGWKPRGSKHIKVLFKKVKAPAKKYRIVLSGKN